MGRGEKKTETLSPLPKSEKGGVASSREPGGGEVRRKRKYRGRSTSPSSQIRKKVKRREQPW